MGAVAPCGCISGRTDGLTVSMVRSYSGTSTRKELQIELKIIIGVSVGRVAASSSSSSCDFEVFVRKRINLHLVRIYYIGGRLKSCCREWRL